MTEQLEYKNIFDAITDDHDEAAEMKRNADQMIIERGDEPCLMSCAD